MSTNQQLADEQTDASADDQSDEQPDDSGQRRHPNYEETTISAYGSNSKAHQAFRNWQIKPSRTRTRSKLGKSFDRRAFYHYGSSAHYFQFPSGLGFGERTNRQNRGGMRCRLPSGETLAGLNIDQVNDFLGAVGGPNIAQLRAQHGAERENGRFDTRENFVLEFEAGEYAVILYDGSANRRARTSATRAGMLVEPTDPHYAHVQQLLDREAYGQLSDMVAPDEVLASDFEVITSSEYRDKSGRANCGGFGDEETLGEYIIRQGEWYFIPQPDLEFATNEIDKPFSRTGDETVLGSHVPRDQAVIECEPEQQRLHQEAEDQPDPGIYVRGTVRHSRNEHSMFNLHETWHKVVENTEDMFAFEARGGGRFE